MQLDKQLASAKVRTVLANQRTFLAYLRTALSFVMAGLALIHYFHGFFDIYIQIGSVFTAVGLGIFIWGGVKTYRSSKEIEELH